MVLVCTTKQSEPTSAIPAAQPVSDLNSRQVFLLYTDVAFSTAVSVTFTAPQLLSPET